jgi:hypothetical protein
VLTAHLLNLLACVQLCQKKQACSTNNTVTSTWLLASGQTLGVQAVECGERDGNLLNHCPVPRKCGVAQRQLSCSACGDLDWIGGELLLSGPLSLASAPIDLPPVGAIPCSHCRRTAPSLLLTLTRAAGPALAPLDLLWSASPQIEAGNFKLALGV